MRFRRGPAPRGGVLDPRIAVPFGLALTAFGVFLVAGASGLRQIAGVLLVLAGVAYLAQGVLSWREMRQAGQRPGSDPPL